MKSKHEENLSLMASYVTALAVSVVVGLNKDGMAAYIDSFKPFEVQVTATDSAHPSYESHGYWLEGPCEKGAMALNDQFRRNAESRNYAYALAREIIELQKQNGLRVKSARSERVQMRSKDSGSDARYTASCTLRR